jgi:sugar/nucleoside kinase (ribokinase family)
MTTIRAGAGEAVMNSYDVVFLGHIATGEIVPYEGPSFFMPGSPLFFSSIAASRAGKKIAAVTRIPDGREHLLEPMRSAGVSLFVRPGEIVEYRVLFPTPDVDKRQPYLLKAGDDFTIQDIPDIPPCLVHMCCMGPREFQLDLMRALKDRGFFLSVDMQNFVLQADKETGAVLLQDVPEKEEIFSMAHFVKLDAMEAQVLTGIDDLQGQGVALQKWGDAEIVITSSEGASVRSKGKTTFTRFTNRSTLGRMGRGDTVMGSYLARRIDHSAEDSIRFAAALTSIKMEAIGPFIGSVEDVIGRMDLPAPA